MKNKNQKLYAALLGGFTVVVVVAVAVMANNGKIFQGYLNVRDVRPVVGPVKFNPGIIKYLSPEPAPAPKIIFQTATTPASSTLHRGMTNAPLFGINMTYPASAPSPFKVTALTFIALIDNDTSGKFSVTGHAGPEFGNDTTANVKDEIGSVGLYNGSTLLALANVSVDGQINFAPISLMAVPGQTQTLTIRGDISNGFNLGQFNDRIKLAMYGVGGYGINADYSSALNGNDADSGVIQTIAE